MQIYNQLVSSIAGDLKPLGFTKTKQTLYLKRANNWGLLDFQKRKGSSATSMAFTINMGIFSGALNDYYQRSSSDKPDIENCHWRERIGGYLIPKEDKWWLIDEQTNLESLKNEISVLLKDIALPLIDSHISDELLVLAWLKGEYGGNTEEQKIKHLTVFLSKSDKESLFNYIRNAYPGKKVHPIVQDHLKEFGIYEFE